MADSRNLADLLAISHMTTEPHVSLHCVARGPQFITFAVVQIPLA